MVIVAGIGLLLCAGGLVGVWFVDTPVTNAVKSTTEVAKSYLAFASNTTAVTSDQLESLRTQLDALGARVEAIDAGTREAVVAEATTTFQARFGATISTIRTTFAALRTGTIALNQSLESANRIPGVTVPTFSDQLQAADQHLDSIDIRFTEIRTSLSDASIDVAGLEAKITAAFRRSGIDRRTRQSVE